MHAEKNVTKKNNDPIPDYVFELGDTCIVRHLDNSPQMVVKKKVMYNPTVDNRRGLKAVLLYWFLDGDYKEQEFPHQDVRIVKRAREGANK